VVLLPIIFLCSCTLYDTATLRGDIDKLQSYITNTEKDIETAKEWKTKVDYLIPLLPESQSKNELLALSLKLDKFIADSTTNYIPKAKAALSELQTRLQSSQQMTAAEVTGHTIGSVGGQVPQPFGWVASTIGAILVAAGAAYRNRKTSSLTSEIITAIEAQKLPNNTVNLNDVVMSDTAKKLIDTIQQSLGVRATEIPTPPVEHFLGK
jgi:hypothetical protein